MKNLLRVGAAASPRRRGLSEPPAWPRTDQKGLVSPTCWHIVPKLPASPAAWIPCIRISNFLFAATHISIHNTPGSAQASRRVTDLATAPTPHFPGVGAISPKSGQAQSAILGSEQRASPWQAAASSCQLSKKLSLGAPPELGRVKFSQSCRSRRRDPNGMVCHLAWVNSPVAQPIVGAPVATFEAEA